MPAVRIPGPIFPTAPVPAAAIPEGSEEAVPAEAVPASERGRTQSVFFMAFPVQRESLFQS